MLFVLLGSVYIYLFFQFGFTEESGEITYTLKVNKARDVFKNEPKAGDTVYDYESGEAIGTVLSVDCRNYTEYDNNRDGSGEYITVPGYVAMDIVISANGLVKENGGRYVNVGAESYREGAEGEFYTRNFYFIAAVICSDESEAE